MNDVMASDVYEIVFENPSGPKSWLRVLRSLVVGVISVGGVYDDPGGVILTVRHRETGEQLFRHIEEMDEDEDHFRSQIENDLTTMTAAEFEAAWRVEDLDS